jgi:sugar phosphate permease
LKAPNPTSQITDQTTRYRWIVLVVTWTSYLAVFLARLSIGPLAPFLKDAFNLSNTQVGSLVTATAITYGPTMLIAGWLADRVGVRRMLILGTLITSLCMMAIFFAPSYRGMLVILALAGLGTGCIFPAAVKAIIIWFPLRERATALGFNQSAVNVGGIIGASVLPTIAITLGWRYGFLFAGFGILAMCLSCAILYRNPPQGAVPMAIGDVQGNASAQPSATRLTIQLFKSRDIWMLSLAGLFLGVVEHATMTYLVLYLKESLLFGAVAAGGLLAMTEAAGAFGKPASGLASDRLLKGRRKIVFILMGATASITCLVLGAWGQDLGWLMYPVLIILGAVAIGFGGIFATMAGELGGKELAGIASGASAAVLILGVVTGPLFFGYIVDSTGSFQTAWLIMALSGAISTIFASMIRERKERI